MRDVKIKPIKIEPIKIMLLIGLASAVMGLSACNKSDSHKTAQTPNIASAPSEDVKVAEEISEQAAEQITEQGETPMTPHDQAGRDDSAAQSEVRSMAECRALALKSEKLACMKAVSKALKAKNAALEAEEKALDAQIAAALSDVRPISECHAMTSGSEKENCYWAISDALGVKADAKRLQCRAMTVKSEQQACVKVLGKIEEAQGTALDGGLAEQDKTIAALDAENAAVKARRAEYAKEIAAKKAENEQKRIRNDALLRDIGRKAAQGSK